MLWSLFSFRRHTEILSPLMEFSSGALAVISETLMQKSHGWAIGRRFVFDLGSVWACPVFMSLQSDSSPAKPTGRIPEAQRIQSCHSQRGDRLVAHPFPNVSSFRSAGENSHQTAFMLMLIIWAYTSHPAGSAQLTRSAAPPQHILAPVPYPLHTQPSPPAKLPFLGLCLFACLLPCFDVAAFICLFYVS